MTHFFKKKTLFSRYIDFTAKGPEGNQSLPNAVTFNTVGDPNHKIDFAATS